MGLTHGLDVRPAKGWHWAGFLPLGFQIDIPPSWWFFINTLRQWLGIKDMRGWDVIL